MPHNALDHTGALRRLRKLVPHRPLSIDEALHIAELQASHLLMMHHVDAPPISEEVVLSLPKIRLEHVTSPISGACYWDGTEWVIEVNQQQRFTRQRFVTAHEFKHIIDHGYTDYLYPPITCDHQLDHAEYVADYFAGCLLVPRVLLKRAYMQGLQSVHDLADLFQVSERSITIRLNQIGILDPTPRCMDRHHTQRAQLAELTRKDAA